MNRTAIGLALWIGILMVPITGSAEPAAEHLEWGRWALDYEIRDNTGLTLRNVSYGGEMVLGKASMPVVRVKYVKERVWWNPFTWFGSRADSGRCGPFQDRLRWQDLAPIANCSDNKVCVDRATVNGVQWLEIGTYARIGEYHLYQAWHFSEDGEMRPILHSRGLSCNTDHHHHPYWRLDIDVNGNGLDQVFVHDRGGPDNGWGAGWRKYTNERNDVKSPATERVWFVRDQPTGHGLWILPGDGYLPLKNDGERDKFGDLDVAIRRANPAEDLPWIFGARGQLGYDEDNQGVQEQDVVVWYVAHLPHMAALGPTKWLTLGPTLKIQR
ncbi:MAG: hypothetical protein IT391_11775 [Nitrospira sp.]|nr:hypothetical protein [Nitrospira sp.]